MAFNSFITEIPSDKNQSINLLCKYGNYLIKEQAVLQFPRFSKNIKNP